MKIGPGKLSTKHRWRLQLSFGISTLHMEAEELIAGIIDTWLESRADEN